MLADPPSGWQKVNTNTDIAMLAEPTPDQRRAFDLIGTPIPLTAA